MFRSIVFLLLSINTSLYAISPDVLKAKPNVLYQSSSNHIANHVSHISPNNRSNSSLNLTPKRIFPPALKRGDTIAIIAPASFPEEDQQAVSRAVKMLTQQGYRVRVSANLFTRFGYLAGTDYDRAKNFMDAWLDPDVKALWCYRGGYGCTRILDRLDYDEIAKHPKILIGMSDVTALHAAIQKETGLVTFLGPTVNNVYGRDQKSDSVYGAKELWNMISFNNFDSGGYLYPVPKGFPGKENPSLTIKPGVARGVVVGGTLSLVASLIGTPWEINTEGKILVLEEVNEEPYRIDRWLRQLQQSGGLDHLSGVVLCSWRSCQGSRPERSFTLEQIFKDYFSGVAYPVFLGFPSGHISDQATIPLNVLAEMDATKRTLRILESPVLD